MQAIENYGLNEREINIISEIFKKYSQVKDVRIFGSRAKGIFHCGSDVDLSICGGEVTPKILRQIKSDLEESNLPYNVDLLDFNKINNTALKEHIIRVGKPLFNIFTN